MGAITSALLTGRGHQVIGLDAPPVDRDAQSCPTRDDPHPLLATQQSVPTLLRLVMESGASLVIPTLPGELQEVAAARSLLERIGAQVMIAGAGPVALVSDHLFALSHLQSRKVVVPRFLLPSEAGSARAAFETFDGTFVATPRSKASAAPPVLFTAADAEHWGRLDDHWMLRAVVPGEHYRVLVHRPAQGKDGRLSVVVHDPRAQSGPWGRRTDGPVPTATIVDLPEVERAALAAIRAVGLTGRASVEVVLDPTGTAIVTGIDATFGSHLRLAPQLLDLALEEHRAPVPAEAATPLRGPIGVLRQ
jgi:hypothetical protein